MEINSIILAILDNLNFLQIITRIKIRKFARPIDISKFYNKCKIWINNKSNNKTLISSCNSNILYKLQMIKVNYNKANT